MWSDFLNAFKPLFDDFFFAVNEVIGLFFGKAYIIGGQSISFTLFGVPIIFYPLCLMFVYFLFRIIFTGD